MNENKPSYKYDAFISYRHTEPDKTIAEKLHRMLETFKVPKAIVKKGGQKKVGRVFRDRDELPTSSNLADNIQMALESSEHLIVICSPRTPQSQWVLKEIETFSKIHGHDRILALLIEGEPIESFPDALRFVKTQTVSPDGTIVETVTEVEPLAADIRDKSINGMKKKLKTEILRLLAPVLGCRFDDLRQRHRERVIKRVLTVSISLSAFFLAFGSFTAYQSMLIKQQSEVVKQQSEVVREQSEQLKIQVEKTLSGQSLYLSDVANRLYDEGDRRTAILVALEALPKDLGNPERPYREEAEYALGQALEVYKNDNRFVPDVALTHDKNVNFVKLSPDGKTAVSSAQDGNLYVWDTVNGELKNQYNTGDQFIYAESLYFVNDQQIIFTTDNNLVCLNIETMEPLWETAVYSMKMAISKDKTMAAVIMDSVQVLDIATGNLLFEYNIEDLLEGGADDFQYASCIRFDDSGRYVIAGTSNGDILVFDLSAKKLEWQYKSHYEFVNDVALSPDGYLAISSYYIDGMDLLSKGEGYLEILELTGKSKVFEKAFDYSALGQLSFHPDDSNVLFFTEEEKLDVLNIENKSVAYAFIHGGRVTDYYVSGDFIMSASDDGNIRTWVMRDAGFELENNRVVMKESIKQFVILKGTIAVTYKQSDKACLLRNLENKDVFKLGDRTTSITGTCYTADGSRMLLYPNNKGELILWDMVKRDSVASYTKEEDDILQGVYFVDGDQKILTITMKGKVTLLNATSLEVITTKEFGSIFESGINPEGSLVVIGTNESTDTLKTSDLSLVSSIPERNSFDCLAFYSDNSQFISSSSFRRSGCYDLKTGKLVYEFPAKKVMYTAISHDDKLLALIYEDNAVHILDAKTFEEKLVINDYAVLAKKLFFDPWDKTLFVAMDDNTVRRYDVSSGKFVAEMEGLLSSAEKIVYDQELARYAITGFYHETLIWRDSNNKKLFQMGSVYGLDPAFKSLVAVKSDGSIMLFPLYTLPELMDKAKQLLGDKTLTQEEKEKLFIVE